MGCLFWYCFGCGKAPRERAEEVCGRPRAGDGPCFRSWSRALLSDLTRRLRDLARFAQGSSLVTALNIILPLIILIVGMMGIGADETAS